jgi:hypothetical protein
MAHAIQFRVRLNAEDWDSGASAYRCSALALPDAKVIAIHANGQPQRLVDFQSDRATREIRFVGPEDRPLELLITIQIEPRLTTWRTAGLSGGGLALATALVTAVAQYMAAVGPAKLDAETQRRRIEAESVAKQHCVSDLETASKELSKYTGKAVTNITTGNTSPIQTGAGTLTINQGGGHSP